MDELARLGAKGKCMRNAERDYHRRQRRDQLWLPNYHLVPKVPIKRKRHRKLVSWPVLLPHEVFSAFVSRGVGGDLLWGDLDLEAWWLQAKASGHAGFAEHPAYDHSLPLSDCLPIKLHGALLSAYQGAVSPCQAAVLRPLFD